ncbi:MAG: hypothetical protein P8Y12_05860, partial [Gammaproteobacteria bacterium]
MNDERSKDELGDVFEELNAGEEEAREVIESIAAAGDAETEDDFPVLEDDAMTGIFADEIIEEEEIPDPGFNWLA